VKTVGEILKQARTDQSISLATIAGQTKIQVKYIRALEENRFDKLPPAAFVKGFVRAYARVVNKDPESLLAIFRRDYDQDDRGQIVPRGLAAVERQRWLWNPTMTWVTAVAIIVTVFVAYLLFQFRLLSKPPELTVTEPIEASKVSRNVAVAGKSDVDATVAVNSKEVVLNDKGEFRETLLLSSGEHTITVKATARNGKTKTMQRTVTVQ